MSPQLSTAAQRRAEAERLAVHVLQVLQRQQAAQLVAPPRPPQAVTRQQHRAGSVLSLRVLQVRPRSGVLQALQQLHLRSHRWHALRQLLQQVAGLLGLLLLCHQQQLRR